MKHQNFKPQSTQTFLFGIDTNLQFCTLFSKISIHDDIMRVEKRHIPIEKEFLKEDFLSNTTSNVPDLKGRDILLYLTGKTTQNMKTVLKRNDMETKKFIKFVKFSVVMDYEGIKDFRYTIFDKETIVEHDVTDDANIKNIDLSTLGLFMIACTQKEIYNKKRSEQI